MIYNVFVKRSIFLFGVILILLAFFLPVDYIVNIAISSKVKQEIIARSTPERILQLQEQLKRGLVVLRIVAALLGLWLAFLFCFWKYLIKWVSEVRPRLNIKSNDNKQSIVFRREIFYPIFWFILIIILGIPLLSKGLDLGEAVNLVMLAKRGPLVSAACQNVALPIAQPGYTVIESIFVKLFGSSEAAARLPALLLGALGIFPLFFLSRKFGKVCFANIVCLALTVTGVYHFYNTNAKGYSITLSFYLLVVVLLIFIRERSSWLSWICLFFGVIIAAYSHFMAIICSGYLSAIVVFDRTNRLIRKREKPLVVLKSWLEPIVIFTSAFLFVFLLCSVGIPAFIDYAKITPFKSFYTAYHIGPRFFKIIIEEFAIVRDFYILGYLQALFFILGVIWGLRKFFAATIYLILPIIGLMLYIWGQGYTTYFRYFLIFLPIYTLFSIFGFWQLLNIIFPKKERVTTAILVFLLLISSVFTFKRLYTMERCGIKTAVKDAKTLMNKGDRILGVLDGFVVVEYYYPQLISGQRDKNFWQEVNKSNPPEFVINVPYLEMDIPGATEVLLKKYDLIKKYPGWPDVDDDQDSIYLYRIKNKK